MMEEIKSLQVGIRQKVVKK